MSYDLYASLVGEVGTAESYERRIDADVVECVMDSSVSLRAAAGSRTTRLSILGDEQTIQHLGADGMLVDLEDGRLSVTYKLSKTLSICAAGFNCCLNCTNIAANHNAYKTATDFFCSDKCYVCCLKHRICSFDCCYKTSCFYHT